MAKTVESGATPYCSVEQLFSFIDSRTVASMLRDDETDDLPTTTDMADDTDDAGARLLALLMAGSGEVEAACLPRGQYSADDLAAIYASDSNASYHLQRVTAGCTILALFGRRHNSSRTSAENYPAVMHAADALERLRVGEHVFGTTENIEAGKGMTAIPFVNQDDTTLSRTVNRARRFFGSAGRRDWE